MKVCSGSNYPVPLRSGNGGFRRNLAVHQGVDEGRVAAPLQTWGVAAGDALAARSDRGPSFPAAGSFSVMSTTFFRPMRHHPRLRPAAGQEVRRLRVVSVDRQAAPRLRPMGEGTSRRASEAFLGDLLRWIGTALPFPSISLSPRVKSRIEFQAQFQAQRV
jgi:hypothetical protein